MVLPLRIRILRVLDRAVLALLATVVLGTSLAFGGAAWWVRPALAVLLTSLALVMLARAPLLGVCRVLRSPLGLLWSAVLLLAVVQLAPLPARWAGLVSPRAREVYAHGVLLDLARADDPGHKLSGPSAARSPATLDRSATTRWLFGGLGCLVLFGVTAHFADRLSRALVAWGCVVVAFLVNAVFASVQLLAGSSGLYGATVPGEGGLWGPSMADAMATPGSTVLRIAADPLAGGMGWAVARPLPDFLLGSLPGGPGGFLALASLALPLSLGLALHALAPRGSREGLSARIRGSGLPGLIALLVALCLAGGLLVGLLAGSWLSLPFALGIVLAGLPSAIGTGLRWTAVALTATALAALGMGAWLGQQHGEDGEVRSLSGSAGWRDARRTWSDSSRMVQDFPVVGTGLGSFGTVYPSYKTSDPSPNTARSTLLQFAVESGWAGLGILALVGLWCLVRWPSALRRVGTADRALAFGLTGAAACFATFSALHWTVELPAIAVAASAVAGTLNRWLAGGTDLFVEPA